MGSLVNANELKRKVMIELDGQPFVVVEVFFAAPTARGASTMVKAKIRNLLNGAVLDKTFKTSEKFKEPDVEVAPASFLYADADGFYFMDDASFEQFSLSQAKMEDLKGFMKEGIPIQALKFNGQYVSLQLPVYVDLKVTYAEPIVKGDSGGGTVTKAATLETGKDVKVPMYIKEGDVVKVNTQTGEVSGRA